MVAAASEEVSPPARKPDIGRIDPDLAGAIQQEEEG